MPRRSFLVGSIVALAVCFLAAGCGGRVTPPPPTTGMVPGILRVAQRSDFRTLDPAVANDVNLVELVRVIFQPLLEYDAESRLVPLIAEEVPTLVLRESDGKAADLPRFAASMIGLAGLTNPLGAAAALCPGRITPTYTFHLKKGVRFSNGREVTAEDFVYAWTRLLDPKTKSAGASYIVDRIVGAHKFADGGADDVEGLRAPDRSTLEVSLVKADFTFLYVAAMTFLAPVPREEIEKYPEEDRNELFAAHPVGTGPFMLKEWRRGLWVRLERDPHYWGPNHPGLQGIEVKAGLDDLTMQMMFERGELDMTQVVPAPDYVRLKKDPRWQPYFEKLSVNGEYYLNLNCEMPPFNGPNGKLVRQAFNYAINKERIVHVTNDRYTAGVGVVPPNMPGFHSHVKGYSYDPEKAKALLTEAGYYDHPPEKLTLWLANETSAFVRIAEVIEQNLADVGVKVELNPVNYDVFLPAAGKRGSAAFSLSGWYQDYPDPSDFLGTLFSTNAIAEVESNNMAFYSSEKADQLMAAGDQEPDLEKRMHFYEDAEEVIVDDAPVAPLVNGVEIWMRQPWVKGFQLHPVWLVRYEDLTISPP